MTRVHILVWTLRLVDHGYCGSITVVFAGLLVYTLSIMLLLEKRGSSAVYMKNRKIYQKYRLVLLSTTGFDCEKR